MASVLADTLTSAACPELPPTNVRPSCPFPAKPQDIWTPQPSCSLLLLSRAPSPGQVPASSFSTVSLGCSACPSPMVILPVHLHTPCSPHTAAQQDTPAPHHHVCPISPGPFWSLSWGDHILCPTPNVSHLFPVTALLRRWHAPSPSTAYCIFGKTCSLLAMRHYESHLNTMAPGVAWARLALPCHRCSA